MTSFTDLLARIGGIYELMFLGFTIVILVLSEHLFLSTIISQVYMVDGEKEESIRSSKKFDDKFQGPDADIETIAAQESTKNRLERIKARDDETARKIDSAIKAGRMDKDLAAEVR